MTKSKILIIIAILLLFVISLESKRIRATFVGIDACKRCHDNDSIGDQYKLWASTPHANAFQSLRSVIAMQIAKKYDIKKPSEDRRCLKCHATGGGKNPDIIYEGVGCEACHGPGSRYKDFDNHASFDNRKNAYKKAIRLGMYPIIGDDHIKGREKLCRYCHNAKRLCITNEDIVNKKNRPLPLTIIADFIYKHSLR